MYFNMSKPIEIRKGRRIEVFSTHSTINGRKYLTYPATGEYMNYELTIYENCISIRQHSAETGSYITWMPIEDILCINEQQVEDCQPIELSLAEYDWPKACPQK